MPRDNLWPVPHRIPVRERLKNLYFILFSSNVNRCIVGASLVLLVVSIFQSACVMSLWYHVAEGMLTFLFAGEVGLRLAVMRGDFWESAYNVSEVVACIVCITIFSILHVTRQQASLAEHRVLILLRYIGQLLRMFGLVAVDTLGSTSSESDIQLFAVNGAKFPSSDMRENYRDVL